MSYTFFQRGEKYFRGLPLLATGLGQSLDREAPNTLSASAQFAPLPAEAGCETC